MSDSTVWISTPHRTLSYAELHDVKRDICYLYHELVPYGMMMGDLNYGKLPYWEYLNISGLYEEENAFIQQGCLVMILAMIWDVLDDSGAYLLQNNLISHCLRAIGTMEATEMDTYRLAEIVTTGLHLLQSPDRKEKELEATLRNESNWVFQRFVLGYFQNTVEHLTKRRKE